MANPSPNPKGWFKKGNPGGPGNPFIESANVFRSDFWAGCTPERRKALIDLMWARALGQYREPEYDADTGLQKEWPDGSPRFKPPQPPCPRAQEFICNFLGGAMSFKSVESTVQVNVSDDAEKVRAAAEFIKSVGMLESLPAEMRVLVAGETENRD